MAKPQMASTVAEFIGLPTIQILNCLNTMVYEQRGLERIVTSTNQLLNWDCRL